MNSTTATKPGAKIFNFNLGILGHVDSGKTTLAKALSTVASTAAFDKNPDSQRRGITLDLGFSSFVIDTPPNLLGSAAAEDNSSNNNSKDSSTRRFIFDGYDKLQFTLVDCPGHASLIKTIIGGAQIIDMVLLVVDCTKGVQTQTAECLILAEITCPGRMIVVLNKIDQFPDDKRQAQIEKITSRLRKTLENTTTTFKDAPIVPVSAAAAAESINVNLLIDTILSKIMSSSSPPRRRSARDAAAGKFLFAVDHCFAIRGQGSVMTGTVLSGSVKVGDQIEIPSLRETKKIRSMQIFRQPVDRASQGDRVGICVTQFDAKSLERGLACQPGATITVHAALVDTRRIAYFKPEITSNKMKLHITVGHETVMGKCLFFGCRSSENNCDCRCGDDSDNDDDGGGPTKSFNLDQDYVFIESYAAASNNNDQQRKSGSENYYKHRYALLEFDHPILCPSSPGSTLYIASKLDTDIHANSCRLAFYGRILVPYSDGNYRQRNLHNLRIYKCKSRQGTIERVHDPYTLIANGLFKKGSNMESFVGLKVTVFVEENDDADEAENETERHGGQRGVIEGGFGQNAKVKIRIPEGINETLMEILQERGSRRKTAGKRAAGEPADPPDGAGEKSKPKQASIRVVLKFKRYVYDPQKKMVQV